jgi:hypothetical protein
MEQQELSIRPGGLGGTSSAGHTSIRDKYKTALDRYNTDLERRCPVISNNYNKLNQIVSRYGQEIDQAWRSSNRKKKRRFLTAIWIGIPKQHRPDLNNENPSVADCMWPYISQEDLVDNGENLLTMIHSRATHPWTEYANMDLDSTTRGWEGVPGFPDTIPPWRHPSTLGTANDNGEDFRITFIEDGVEHDGRRKYFRVEETHSVEQRQKLLPFTFNYASAALIAKVQERLYINLVKICQHLLRPMPLNAQKEAAENEQEYQERFAEQFPLDGEPSAAPESTPSLTAPSGNDEVTIKVLSEARRCAPYGKPANLDLEIAGDLIRGRAAAAKETLEELRANPGFFESSIRQERELIGEAEGTKKAKEDDEFTEEDGPKWKRALEASITLPIQAFDQWAAMQDTFESLQTTYEGIVDKTLISPQNRSPNAVAAQQAFERALIPFQHIAFTIRDRILAKMFAEAKNNVLFKEYIEFRPMYNNQDANQSQNPKIPCATDTLKSLLQEARTCAESNKRIPENCRKGMVYEKFRVILESYVRRHMLTRLPALIDELDRLFKEDPNLPKGQKANVEFLPVHVRPELEDLAILAECLSQVDNFRPWSLVIIQSMAAPPKTGEANKMSTANNLVAELDRPARQLALNSPRIWEEVYKLAIPYAEKFAYPAPEEERTTEVVKTMRSSEQNLREFWDPLIKLLKQNTAVSARVLALLEPTPELTPLRPKQKQTTKLEAAEAEPGPSQPSQKDQGATAEGGKPSESSLSLWEQRQALLRAQGIDDTAEQSRPATPKTTTASQTAVTPAAADNRIRVSREVMDTLSILMFEQGRTGGARRELPWKDFLRAMSEIGYRTITQGSGSEVNFHPDKSILGNHVPIKFHSPHPEKKLSFNRARMYGSRLCKRHGWTLDSFTER